MSQALRLLRDDKGATSIEYGLIATLIACGLVLSLSTVGNSLGLVLSTLADGLGSGVAPTAPPPPIANHLQG